MAYLQFVFEEFPQMECRTYRSGASTRTYNRVLMGMRFLIYLCDKLCHIDAILSSVLM
jgi:hypothetical protein